MSAPLLDVRAVTRRFGGLTAVDELSLDLRVGEILALIGPNGAGKTTTFNLIAGAYRPNAGEIYFDGSRIDGAPASRRAGLGLARTFQHNMPFNGLSLLDNVLVGRHAKFQASFVDVVRGARAAGAEEIRAREIARAQIEFVRLSHRLGADVSTLGFGEGRLLELARALASEPRALLLDEPAAGLTLAEMNNLGALIRQVAASGVAILLIDHDMRFVLPLAHRIVVIEFGRKIAEGLPSDIANDANVRRAYLGGGARA